MAQSTFEDLCHIRMRKMFDPMDGVTGEDFFNQTTKVAVRSVQHRKICVDEWIEIGALMCAFHCYEFSREQRIAFIYFLKVIRQWTSPPHRWFWSFNSSVYENPRFIESEFHDAVVRRRSSTNILQPYRPTLDMALCEFNLLGAVTMRRNLMAWQFWPDHTTEEIYWKSAALACVKFRCPFLYNCSASLKDWMAFESHVDSEHGFRISLVKLSLEPGLYHINIHHVMHIYDVYWKLC